jgi:hypothetical protein
MTENWLPIPGWEGLYEVSDHGRIKSLDRVVSNGATTVRRIPGRCLKLVERDGYMTATLKKGDRQQRVYVNRLMLLVFKPIAGSEELQSCHRNGRRDDNRLDNLRWDDHAGNAADRAIHGTSLVGEGHPNSRLCDESVRIIRASSDSCTSLAKRFGVSQSVVSKARLRQTWRHVE